MAEEIFVGVVVLILGAIIFGLLRVSRHVRDADVENQRALKDYARWSRRAYKERKDDFYRIGAAFRSEGLYASEEHLAEVERMLKRYENEQEDRITEMSRSIDDSFRRLRRIDLLFMAITMTKAQWQDRVRGIWAVLTRKPVSFEQGILEPAQRMATEGEIPNERFG